MTTRGMKDIYAPLLGCNITSEENISKVVSKIFRDRAAYENKVSYQPKFYQKK